VTLLSHYYYDIIIEFLFPGFRFFFSTGNSNMLTKVKQNFPKTQPDSWKHTGKPVVTLVCLGVIAAFTTGEDHVSASRRS